MFQWLLHGYAVALGLKLCQNCLEVFGHLNKDPPPHFSFLINSRKMTYLVLDVPPECVNQGLSSGAPRDLWSNHLAVETPNASPSLTPEQ